MENRKIITDSKGGGTRLQLKSCIPSHTAPPANNRYSTICIELFMVTTSMWFPNPLAAGCGL